MLVELARNYIKVINEGEVPVIENIWTCVQKTEQQRVYNDALQGFILKSKTLQSENLKEELKKAKIEACQ
jgi:hypothetical protein